MFYNNLREVSVMRNQKYHIYLTNEELGELIRQLIKSKNDLISMGRYTDVVDDLIIKVSKAKRKKLKIKYALDN